MKVPDRRVNQRFYLTLSAITLVVAVLRLLWLDQTTFAFDQAQVSLRALAMARAGRFGTTGMSSSVGVPNFGAAVWFFALIYRFTTDPLVATAAVALANAAGVYGLGLIGRRMQSSAAGLLAAVLYALSPWAILFSRSI